METTHSERYCFLKDSTINHPGTQTESRSHRKANKPYTPHSSRSKKVNERALAASMNG